MARQAHISNELFGFLAELKLNNDREWFQANKDRYRAVVLDPLVDFVADFGEYLRDINPHFVADPRPMGGSIFRIYRDVRFSKDKSPYKTQAAIHFRHEMGREVHGPGYYLHLEPGEVYAGVGVWHPGSESLGEDTRRHRGQPGAVEVGRQRVRSSPRSTRWRATRSSGRPRATTPDHPSHPRPEAQGLRSRDTVHRGGRVRAGLHRHLRGHVPQGRAVHGVPDQGCGVELVGNAILPVV